MRRPPKCASPRPGSRVAWAIAFALFVWWFSTGLIIYLDNLPRRTHPVSMAAATLVLAGCLQCLRAVADDTSVAGAYAGFTCGLLAWGWQEMSFFTGTLTGPVRAPCPSGATIGRRFRGAVLATAYHELACAVVGLLLVWMAWGTANQVGMWTYLLLWGARQSAKFNVFLGVRNLNEDFVPEHLAFIRGYMRERPMNLLFPVCITGGTVLCVWLVGRVGTAAPGFDATQAVFLATLMVLAVLEHWFLVLPVPFAALWNWSLRAVRWRPALPSLPSPAPHQAGGD